MVKAFKRSGFITGMVTEINSGSCLPEVTVTLDNGLDFKVGPVSLEEEKALEEAFMDGRYKYELMIGVKTKE